MDKWTFNMAAGAVLSALLVIVGTSTLIDIIYPRGGTPEAAPEVTADASSGEQTAPEGEGEANAPSFASLLSAASVDSGAKQVKKCAACHVFEEGGPNKIGPNLHDIVGRAVASVDGFAYSNALKEYGGNWDYEKLDCFLKDPKNCVPGNKMSFAGVKKDGDRADIIAYMRSVSPNAPPMPAVSEAASEPAGSDSAAAAPNESDAAPSESDNASSESKPSEAAPSGNDGEAASASGDQGADANTAAESNANPIPSVVGGASETSASATDQETAPAAEEANISPEASVNPAQPPEQTQN